MDSERIDHYCGLFAERLKQGDRVTINQFLAENQLSRDEPLMEALSRVLREQMKDQPDARGSNWDPNVSEPVAATVDFETAAFAPRLIGRVVGKYRLLQQIGEGGMGSVFMAEQQEPVRRKVALKVIKPGMDSRRVIARFEAERQALAMMDHENIAKVLDAGTTEDGHPYFVMELVKGVPITRYCDDNRLTIDQRLQLFIPLCRAIQHAHLKGIIHRDIKPSNVLVCNYDGHAVPKVIDFGVAKAVEHQLTDKTMFTEFGQVIGTLQYMSPEQAGLSQLDIDTRSDIYSLGVLLYELLTGSTPLTKDRLRHAARDEAMRLVREEEPQKPSTRLSGSGDAVTSISACRRVEPSRLNALLRGELDWIALKALEKDRTRRYETALSLARDLERYLADDVVEAKPPSSWYRLSKIVRRNRGAVFSGSLLLAVLVTGLLAFGSQWWRAEKALVQADRETTKARKAERDALAAERATSEAFAQLQVEKERADRNAEEANVQFQRATQNHFAARRLSSLQVSLAQNAFEQGKALEMLNLLNQYRRNEKNSPGFEWFYLWNVCGRAQALSRPGGSGLVAFSPVGSQLAVNHPVGQGASEIALWQVDAEEEEQLLAGHSQSLNALVFGGGGRRLASTGRDGMARLWDLESGKAPFAIACGVDARIALNHDGSLLAVSSERGQIELWDPRRGERVAVIEQKAGPITFSTDGQWLAAIDNLGDVVIWDVTDANREIHRIKTGALPSCVLLLPDKKWVVTTGLLHSIGESLDRLKDAEIIHVWNVATGEQTRLLFGHTGIVNSVSASPDGSQLASGGEDGTVRVWELATGRELKRYIGHGSAVTSVAFSADARHVATAGREIIVWDTQQHQRSRVINFTAERPRDIAFGADGRSVATVSSNNLRICDAATGKELLSFSDPDRDLTAVCLLPTGNRIATGNFGGGVKIWDGRTGELVRSMAEKHAGRITDLACNEEGVLASASADKMVKLWNAANGRLLHSITRPVLPGLVTVKFLGRDQSVNVALSFSSDGKRLGIGSRDGDFSIYDVELAEQRLEFRERLPSRATQLEKMLAGGGPLTLRLPSGRRRIPVDELFPDEMTNPGIAFSPDGSMLATTNANESVIVRDTASGEPLVTLRGHLEPIECLMFSSDGSRLATGGRDRTIRIWDIETGETLLRLDGHSDWATCLAFNKDNTRLASGSRDETLRIWEAPKEPAPLPLETLAASHAANKAYGEAIALLEEVIQINRQTYGAGSVECMKSRTFLAMLYNASGKLDLAIECYESLVPARTEKYGRDHRHTISAISNLARLYEGRGDLAKAIPLYEECLRLRESSLETNDSRTLLVMRNLAGAYQKAGRIDDAIDTVVKVFRADPTDFPTRASIQTMIEGLNASRDTTSGIRLHNELLATARKELAHDRYLLTLLNQLASFHFVRGEWAKEISLREEDLPLRRKLEGENTERTLSAMNNLAVAYSKAGRLTDAISLLEETVERKEKSLGRNHASTLISRQSLGDFYRRTGRIDEALPILEEVVKDSRAKLGMDNQHTLTAMNNLAVAFQEKSQFERALLLFNELIPAMNQVLGTEHAETLLSRGNRANLLFTMGRFDDAVAEVEHVIPLFTRQLAKVTDPPARVGLQKTHDYLLEYLGNHADRLDQEGKTSQATYLRSAMAQLRKPNEAP